MDLRVFDVATRGITINISRSHSVDFTAAFAVQLRSTVTVLVAFYFRSVPTFRAFQPGNNTNPGLPIQHP